MKVPLKCFFVFFFIPYQDMAIKKIVLTNISMGWVEKSETRLFFF